MQKVEKTLQDRNGNVVGAAVLTITDYPGGATSTAYATDAVGTNVNPITLDSNGQCTFYIVPGAYTYTYVKSGITTKVETNVIEGSASQSFLQSGTGAVPRTMQSKERDVVSVTDFFANGSSGVPVDPTGVVDSWGGFQAAANYLQTFPTGGKVKVPRGLYKISGGTVTNDRSANSALGRVSFEGEDENGVYISYSGAGANCFYFADSHSGSGDPNASYRCLRNMTITAPSVVANSVGVAVNLGAYPAFENLNIQGFDYGMSMLDVDQANFSHVTLKFNKKGIKAIKNTVVGAASTEPNNFNFVGCVISSNTDYAGYFNGGSCINFYGGDVEYNGSVGAGGYALKFEDCGYQGTRGCNIQGTYFEGNNGVADIWLVNTTVPTPVGGLAVVHEVHADFKRHIVATYTTNHIRCDFGTVANVGLCSLITIGCGYKAYTYAPYSYPPNAARPLIGYVGIAVNSTNFYDLGSNWGAAAAVEVPAFFHGTNAKSCTLTKAALQTFTNATVTTWLLDTITNSPIWTPTIAAGVITIDEAGTYSISINVVLSTTSGTLRQFFLYKNGTLFAASDSVSTANTAEFTTSAVFAAADTLTIKFYQNTGANQDIQVAGTTVVITKIY